MNNLPGVVRPGLEPATSWMQVQALTTTPQNAMDHQKLARISHFVPVKVKSKNSDVSKLSAVIQYFNISRLFLIFSFFSRENYWCFEFCFLLSSNKTRISQQNCSKRINFNVITLVLSLIKRKQPSEMFAEFTLTSSVSVCLKVGVIAAEQQNETSNRESDRQNCNNEINIICKM